MSPNSEPSEPGPVGAALGADRIAQIELYEADLRRHEEALADLGRTATAIRGFAITAVAALVAAGFASGEHLISLAALPIAVYFGFLDYYYSRIDAAVRERLGFLTEFAQNYRRVLAGGVKRRRKTLLKLEGQLSSFDPFGPIPSEPVLWMWRQNKSRERAWKRRQAAAKRKGIEIEGTFKREQAPALGPIKLYGLLYVFLAFVAIGSAVWSNGEERERIILCQPSGQVQAKGEGLELRGCAGDPK